MNFHTDEEWLEINDLEYHEITGRYSDDIVDFLKAYYKYDEECYEFDDSDIPSDYHRYTIRVEDESECGDDIFTTVLHISISLPSDQAAKELADIVDGVVEQGNRDGKQFRIVYTRTVTVCAKDANEARAAFLDMDEKDLRWNSSSPTVQEIEEVN